MGCMESKLFESTMELKVASTGVAINGPPLAPSNACVLLALRSDKGAATSVKVTAKLDVLSVAGFPGEPGDPREMSGPTSAGGRRGRKYQQDEDPSQYPPSIGFTVLHISNANTTRGGVTILHDTVKLLQISELVERSKMEASAAEPPQQKVSFTYEFKLDMPDEVKAAAPDASQGCVLLIPFGRGFPAAAAPIRSPKNSDITFTTPSAKLRMTVTTQNHAVGKGPLGLVVESLPLPVLSAIAEYRGSLAAQGGATRRTSYDANPMHSKVPSTAHAIPLVSELPGVDVTRLSRVNVPISSDADDGNVWQRQGSLLTEYRLSENSERLSVKDVERRVKELFAGSTGIFTSANDKHDAGKASFGGASWRTAGSAGGRSPRAPPLVNAPHCNSTRLATETSKTMSASGLSVGGAGAGGSPGAGSYLSVGDGPLGASLSMRGMEAVEAARGTKWAMRTFPAPTDEIASFEGGQEVLLDGHFSNGFPSCVLFSTAAVSATVHLEITLEAASLPTGDDGDDKGLALVVVGASDRRHSMEDAAHVLYRSVPGADLATDAGFCPDGSTADPEHSVKLPPLEFTKPGEGCGLRFTLQPRILSGKKCVFPSYMIVPLAPPGVRSSWRMKLRFFKSMEDPKYSPMSQTTLQSWTAPVPLGGLRGDVTRPTSAGSKTKMDLTRASSRIPLWDVDYATQTAHQAIATWTTVRGRMNGKDFVADSFTPAAPDEIGAAHR